MIHRCLFEILHSAGGRSSPATGGGVAPGAPGGSFFCFCFLGLLFLLPLLFLLFPLVVLESSAGESLDASGESTTGVSESRLLFLCLLLRFPRLPLPFLFFPLLEGVVGSSSSSSLLFDLVGFFLLRRVLLAAFKIVRTMFCYRVWTHVQ